jgi:peptidoglycan-associated lipoprotein
MQCARFTRLALTLAASAKQIERTSLGEEKPRMAGHDESSWRWNRRSDIVFMRQQ